MRILLVTDAWRPQVNGVVRTLEQTTNGLRERSHEVLCLTHKGKRTFPLPTYPEIRLALIRQRDIARQIETFDPDCIHIATEGTLGWAARRYCLQDNLSFTTSFHSRFPEMLEDRLPVPGLKSLAYAILRRFHAPARTTLVPTPTVVRRLNEIGFKNLQTWTRGVDTNTFKSGRCDLFADLPRPIMMCAGRVAIEKNIEAFLALDLPGTKIVVGAGPQLNDLKARYPDAVFTGYRKGEDLAATLSCADVFVFPSRTDTFGLVMLEAMACGVPVAAYPVEGPIDVITSPNVGVLHDDLATAIKRALQLERSDCVTFARQFSWACVIDQFEVALVQAHGQSGHTARQKISTSKTGRTIKPVA